jgi:hypothetical protein
LDIVTLNEMVDYLRLDEISYDYIEIESLILTAEEYLRNATGFTFATNIPERAKLIVKLMVSHWYENRAIMTTAPNVNKITFTLDVLISQLTYSHTEETVDGDTV